VKDTWEKLIELLSEMVALYRVVLELSRKKSETIIAAKTQDLEVLTRQEELMIIQIGKMETARIKLMRQLVAECGLPAETVTFSQVQGLAEPSVAKRLAKIAEDFDTTLGELAPINLLNTELIQQALRYVNFNINILTQSAASATYAPQGHENQASQMRLVDRKV